MSVKMSVNQIINKVNVMVTGFIDKSFDTYILDFNNDYRKGIDNRDFNEFVAFITHDFLFCTILHGEKGGKYDIREYHSIEFRRLLDENIHAYSKIVEYVDKYFTKYPEDTCQRIEEFKPDTILKYYAFVYTKMNEDLLVTRNCPKFLLEDTDESSSSDEEEDDKNSEDNEC